MLQPCFLENMLKLNWERKGCRKLNLISTWLILNPLWAEDNVKLLLTLVIWNVLLMVLKLWIVTLGKVVKEFRKDPEILLKEKVISWQQFVSFKVREWEQTIVTYFCCLHYPGGCWFPLIACSCSALLRTRNGSAHLDPVSTAGFHSPLRYSRAL